MSTRTKLTRAERRQIEVAIARAKRQDKKQKSAQDSIPFQRMFPDGICRVTDSYYTKTVQFQDINYQLNQNEDKTAIFDGWCDFLNYFDSSVRFQLSFVNMSANKDNYARYITISPQGDDFDSIRLEYTQMFNSWGMALNYLKSHDLADLSDLIENDLIEPEYAGYIPADNPCCPGERCCEYAERIEREYAAERAADEDNEDADVFEYDGEPAISELTGVCRDILTAVEGLTTLLRDEFDYAG